MAYGHRAAVWGKCSAHHGNQQTQINEKQYFINSSGEEQQ